MLGSFLFGGDDVEKKVKVLSGGERNRLALCKMLLSPFNVLIMDEPTNHLDIASKNVLKRALQKFEGTLIVVSHDRDFLQGLTDKVYAFKDQKIKEYLGDINYFLEQHDLEDMREVEKRTKKEVEKKSVADQASSKKLFQDSKQKKQFQNKLSKVETEISKLENEIKLADVKISEDFEKLRTDESFFKNYQSKKDKLDLLMEEWEEITEKLEGV